MMVRLIDTGLWIDLTRSRSPLAFKTFAATHINDPEAHIDEPIAFEMLRNATDVETTILTAYFANMPKLTNPEDLWDRAAKLGQNCRRQGVTVGAIDLLISSVAIFHGAELTTFDDDYLRIASHSPLQVKFLQRPTL
jgi:predicted nucleic acid-binding protein